MAKTIGSFDLASLKNLRDDVTQYFWFESNSSSAWGSGAHVTLYPESQFTNSTNPNYMKGQNIIMNTDGFSIRNGGLPMMVLDNNSLDFNAVDTSLGRYTKMATFGLTGATIGQKSGAHSVIDENGQRFYASDGTTQVANLGYGVGTGSGGGTSNAPYYTLGTRKTTSTQYDPSATYDVGNMCVYNDKIYVCITKIETAEAWTSSHWAYYIGNYSTAQGYDIEASGWASVSENHNSIAIGKAAHAEGQSVASGNYSHSEGGGLGTWPSLNDRAIASGGGSHAQNVGTVASGDASHAQNSRTIASKYAQTALGSYNIEDTSSTTTHPSGNTEYGQYAVLIGNGSYGARSNALTVDWNGNVDAVGSIISDANYEDAWYDSSATQGYTISGLSLAGSTYLGQAIRLEKVSATKKHPIFNGFDISGTGTARIHTLGHYIYISTYNNEQYWYAYIKMRNDNTSAINSFSVTAYIAWM